MTDTNSIALNALVAIVLALIVIRLAFPKKPKEGPGPHNNWRRDKNAGDNSSFHESGSGITGGGD